MWDSEKAVKYLNEHACPKYGIGKCAAFTRRAIRAGGVEVVPPPKASACDFGTSLIGAGFSRLAGDGALKSGDVVVIEACKGAPNGHMAMFNGTHWVSDHEQDALYPGPSYRAGQPKYIVYRFPAFDKP